MSEIRFINIDCNKHIDSCETAHYDLAIVDCITYWQLRKLQESTVVVSNAFDANSKYKSSNIYETIPDQRYFDSLFRVAKKCIIFGDNYLHFAQKKSSTGRIYWNKVNGESNFSDGEILWTNCISSIRSFNFCWHGFNQGKSISDGLNVRAKSDNQVKLQPEEKPYELYAWLINHFSVEGDKILDTHGGGGIIAHACHDLNRDLDICEINPDVFRKSLNRFLEYGNAQNVNSTLFGGIVPKLKTSKLHTKLKEKNKNVSYQLPFKL